jgi:hypothetical protein
LLYPSAYSAVACFQLFFLPRAAPRETLARAGGQSRAFSDFKKGWKVGHSHIQLLFPTGEKSAEISLPFNTLLRGWFAVHLRGAVYTATCVRYRRAGPSVNTRTTGVVREHNVVCRLGTGWGWLEKRSCWETYW